MNILLLLCIFSAVIAPLQSTPSGEYPLLISNDTIIDGNYHQYPINSPITVAPHTALTLLNCVLNNYTTGSIILTDDSSSLILNNSTIILTQDTVWKTGSLIIQGCSHITGPFCWHHNSSAPLIINKSSALLISNNGTFYYAPSSNTNQTVIMADTSSTLALINAQLRCGPHGLVLTKGTVAIAGECQLNPDNQDPRAAIYFGSGHNRNSNITLVMIPPEGKIKIKQHHFFERKQSKNFLTRLIKNSADLAPILLFLVGGYALYHHHEIDR